MNPVDTTAREPRSDGHLDSEHGLHAVWFWRTQQSHLPRSSLALHNLWQADGEYDGVLRALRQDLLLPGHFAQVLAGGLAIPTHQPRLAEMSQVLAEDPRAGSLDR